MTSIDAVLEERGVDWFVFEWLVRDRTLLHHCCFDHYENKKLDEINEKDVKREQEAEV